MKPSSKPSFSVVEDVIFSLDLLTFLRPVEYLPDLLLDLIGLFFVLVAFLDLFLTRKSSTNDRSVKYFSSNSLIKSSQYKFSFFLN